MRWSDLISTRRIGGEAKTQNRKPDPNDLSESRLKWIVPLRPSSESGRMLSEKPFSSTFALFWSAAIDCRFSFSGSNEFLKAKSKTRYFKNAEAD